MYFGKHEVDFGTVVFEHVLKLRLLLKILSGPFGLGLLVFFNLLSLESLLDVRGGKRLLRDFFGTAHPLPIY